MKRIHTYEARSWAASSKKQECRLGRLFFTMSSYPRTIQERDDQFYGPSSSKWLWYDSKHSTTNLMFRTAKVYLAASSLRMLLFLSLFLSVNFVFALSLSDLSVKAHNSVKLDTILLIKAGCDSLSLWQTNFNGKSMPATTPARLGVHFLHSSTEILSFKILSPVSHHLLPRVPSKQGEKDP